MTQIVTMGRLPILYDTIQWGSSTIRNTIEHAMPIQYHELVHNASVVHLWPRYSQRDDKVTMTKTEERIDHQLQCKTVVAQFPEIKNGEDYNDKMVPNGMRIKFGTMQRSRRLMKRLLKSCSLIMEMKTKLTTHTSSSFLLKSHLQMIMMKIL